MKKLCIIHTTPATIASLKPLAYDILGEIELYNFLDDSILPQINREGFIHDEVRQRVDNMMKSAALTNPDVILFACSTIGELTADADAFTRIPVKRIDEPMCVMAVERGKTIGVAATLPSTLTPTCNLIKQKAEQAGKEIVIKQALINGANQLLGEGKTEAYDALVSRELIALKDQVDIVVLAQASMARALDRIENNRELYLTSPVSGLESLRCFL